MSNPNYTRDLTAKKTFQPKKFLGSWEMILVYILIIINVVLMTTRGDIYFAPGTIQAIIQSSLDLSFMVLGMVFILLLGDIDVSIAAIMILSAMTIGLVFQATANAALAIVCGLAAGAACGLFNGVLVAMVGMPAVIVTIASSMFFRGLVQIILGTESLKDFPSWFSSLGWDNILGVPVILWCFILATIVFGLILHKSAFGRKLYIIGNNREAAAYSGISVKKVKVQVFVIMGFMSGVSALFFIGRFGGVSSTMATGYELNTIAIAVLGGVSTAGGKGRIYGPFIAALVMEFLFYALGLYGVEANTRKIITGVVLIVAVLIPMLNDELFASFYKRFMCKNNSEIASLKLKLKADLKKYKETMNEIKADASLSADEKQKKLSELSTRQTTLKEKCRVAVEAVEKDLAHAKNSRRASQS